MSDEYYCQKCGEIFTATSISGFGGTAFCPSCRDSHNEAASDAYAEVREHLIEAGFSDYDASNRAEIAAREVIFSRSGGGPRPVNRCCVCSSTDCSDEETMCPSCRGRYERDERDRERREAEEERERERALADVDRIVNRYS